MEKHFDKGGVREALIAERRLLSDSAKQSAAQSAAGYLKKWSVFHNAKMIAHYSAVEGEFSTSAIAAMASALNKMLCLPVLDRVDYRQMAFHYYHLADALPLNRFLIPEPSVSSNSLVARDRIDLMLVPLVAFDWSGHRMGRGAGCYDRYLEGLKQMDISNRPCLVGVGYDFQNVDHLLPEAWDVSMDYILTESGLYCCAQDYCP